MASAIREAVEVAREQDSAIVSFSHDGNDYVRITFTGKVPLACEELIENGWLIRPSSARKPEITLFK